jgi:hypothetical protein
MNHRLASLRVSPSAFFLAVGVGLASGEAAADEIVVADVSSSVAPDGRAIGVGLEVGAPTTLNVKFMTSPDTGIVVGLGGGAWYDASLSLHGDFLWHPLVARFNSGSFSAYIGGGAWTSLGLGGRNYRGPHYGYWSPYYDQEYVAVGARLPLGLAVAFNEVPIEVFAEVVPALAVFPGIGVFGQGGLGARFYF